MASVSDFLNQFDEEGRYSALERRAGCGFRHEGRWALSRQAPLQQRALCPSGDGGRRRLGAPR